MVPVEDSDQKFLRDKNIMLDDEVAYVQGDLLVIVNVKTDDRRVLGQVSAFLNESNNRRILRG